MITRFVLLTLILGAQLLAKTPAARVTIQLHDSGFMKNGPDNWEENRKHLLKLIEEEKDPKKRKLMAAVGAHGHWTSKELLKDLKNADLLLWNLDSRSFNLPSVIKRRDKNSAKSPTEKQMRQNALAHVEMRDEALKKNGRAPDIVVSPTAPHYLSQTPEDRKKERLIFAEEFKKFFAKYPKTLFVHSAGNRKCNTKESPDYAWSDIDLENLIVVGSCNSAGERSKFSNYGPDVDIYGHGEDVVIDEKELYRFPLFKNSRKYTITGTSFSAPRVANRIAAELTEMRKDNPEATSLDAYKKIRAASVSLKEAAPKTHTKK